MSESLLCDFWDLSLKDLNPDLLKRFDRFQVTTRAWYKTEGIYIINDISFTDDWDTKKKASVIRSLKNCLNNGGTVVGAFLDKTLVGFAAIEGSLFGSNNEYLELSYLHVTKIHRGNGIGTELFNICCAKANDMGAKKLYIGAHPSVKTQKFYKRLGCVYAKEVNPKILKREPLDIQLEKAIGL